MKGINLSEPNTMLEERSLKVELDRKALYALASDSRMEILKALQTDRRTVSQLAELMEADKAGVHRHLKKLEEGGFVSRADDHGFVYYSLTWKARDLISPGENTKIVILISSAFLIMIAIGLILLAASPVYDQGAEKMTDTDQAGNVDFEPNDSGGDGSIYLITSGLLAILVLCLSFVTYRKLRRPKQPNAESSEKVTIDGKRDISD